MARTWLAIKVELVGGRGEELWPRPGRVFAVATTHSFEQLADAINTAFARWDLSHLSEFVLADDTHIGNTDLDDDPPDGMVDSRETKLGRLAVGEQFTYVFDFGDDWSHLCTVVEAVDPIDGSGPIPIDGWGVLPDQYGRQSEAGDQGGMNRT